MNKTARNVLIAIVIFIVILISIAPKLLPVKTTPVPNETIEVTPTPATSAVLGAGITTRTKTTECLVNGKLPDPQCTPGAILPDVTAKEVCVSGYSKNVRNVPESEKNEVYTEYGIVAHPTGAYEVDHLVSLELGGSNDISNLWPEAADPKPGFHEKDLVENYLHQQVCNGAMTLEQAQSMIATDWQKVVLPAK